MTNNLSTGVNDACTYSRYSISVQKLIQYQIGVLKPIDFIHALPFLVSVHRVARGQHFGLWWREGVAFDENP